MDELIKFLKSHDTEYDIGIINNGHYFELSTPFKDKQVIRFKWKKNSINKLIKKLSINGVNLVPKSICEYNGLYDIKETPNQVFIIYAVDSHVQLPKLLLKNFRTSDHLYYLETSNNTIIKSSASKYNTKFGYYSLFFEEYLSKNYEKLIADILKEVTPFINGNVTSITFTNLSNNINKLFLMAFFRNPKYVKQTNEQSIFAQLFKKGFDSEYLALTSEKMNTNFIKNFIPVLVVNETNKGLVTLKSLVANVQIQGIQSMIMLFHPKFAIILIPKKYYYKILQEDSTYLSIDNENTLKKLNQQIYYNAKSNGDDVVGIKEDLDDIIKIIK